MNKNDAKYWQSAKSRSNNIRLVGICDPEADLILMVVVHHMTCGWILHIHDYHHDMDGWSDVDYNNTRNEFFEQSSSTITFLLAIKKRQLTFHLVREQVRNMMMMSSSNSRWNSYSYPVEMMIVRYTIDFVHTATDSMRVILKENRRGNLVNSKWKDFPLYTIVLCDFKIGLFPQLLFCRIARCYLNCGRVPLKCHLNRVIQSAGTTYRHCRGWGDAGPTHNQIAAAKFCVD